MDDGETMAHRVTIVIPTFNRCDLLGECLPSIRAQTFSDYRVLVVDDGSSEDVQAFVGENFPEMDVLRLSENRGFAVAVNAGLREAQGALVFLLNNDMTLDGDCLAKLVEAVDVGKGDLAAPLVLWRDEPEVIYSAGDLQRTNGRPESAGFRCPLEGFDFPETVFGVSAGAGLYRREVFDTVGLLDERFVAYFEDSDLSFRARLAGFRATLVPDARAQHVGSASMGQRLGWRARQCYRNHALLVLKNMPMPLLLRYAPAIVREHLHQALRILSTVRTESGLMRALLALVSERVRLLTLIPHALRERARIQRGRVISIDELRRLLEK